MIQGGEVRGYTIVETMIFLAVTSILFISAMALINGRQANVQFSQGARDAQSKLQDVINQVSAGFFPNPNNFTCKAEPLTLNRPAFDTLVTSEQGTSDTCVFLGKVIQFGVGSDGSGFNVFSVAARRVNDRGLETSSFDEAKPTAIAPTSSADSTPDLTEKSFFQYGLKVTRVTIPDSSGAYGGASSNYGAIAFFGNFPKGTLADPANFGSGAQHVNFGTVPNSAIGTTAYDAATKINAITSSGGGMTTMSPDATLDHGVVVCIEGQGSGHKAWLTVGGTVSGTSVKLNMGESSLCL